MPSSYSSFKMYNGLYPGLRNSSMTQHQMTKFTNSKENIQVLFTKVIKKDTWIELPIQNCCV